MVKCSTVNKRSGSAFIETSSIFEPASAIAAATCASTGGLASVLGAAALATTGAVLAGAALVAKTYSGISISAFISRLQIAIDLSTYFAGLIKAPFMALIIGIIASVEGLKVQGSAESLGRHVTSSVVKSIFVVIVVDGLFAMFYAAIDF